MILSTPFTYRLQRRREFETLTQGTQEYESRFIELSRYYPELIMDDEAKGERFYMGLRRDKISRGTQS